jgi:hypothetical protein
MQPERPYDVVIEMRPAPGSITNLIGNFHGLSVLAPNLLDDL